MMDAPWYWGLHEVIITSWGAKQPFSVFSTDSDEDEEELDPEMLMN
jgi:hypothetical protein